jgi:hypothetical protein
MPVGMPLPVSGGANWIRKRRLGMDRPLEAKKPSEKVEDGLRRPVVFASFPGWGMAKKEEEFHVDFLKKTATKYIHSLPPVLYPFDFAVGTYRKR